MLYQYFKWGVWQTHGTNAVMMPPSQSTNAMLIKYISQMLLIKENGATNS